jgi:hypothetical protein
MNGMNPMVAALLGKQGGQQMPGMPMQGAPQGMPMGGGMPQGMPGGGQMSPQEMQQLMMMLQQGR